MRILLFLALLGCGKDKHNIHVPAQQTPEVNVTVPDTPPPAITVERTVEENTLNFIEKDRTDPPGIDNIEVGKMKCEIRTSKGFNASVCIYGVNVIDDDSEHTKYYSCLLISGQEPACNPIELFEGE